MLLSKQRHLFIVGCAVLLLLLAAGKVATGQSGAYPKPEESTAGDIPFLGEGPYKVGVQTITLVDDSREGRELVTEIWYPALEPEDNYLPVKVFRDAEPDLSGGPYPLVIVSHRSSVYRAWMPLGGDNVVGNRGTLAYMTVPLASHGFVVVAMDHNCDTDPTCWIDRPLDVVFTLDEMSRLAANEWNGIIDPETVGLVGGTTGAYTALAAVGASANPDRFLEWLATEGTEYGNYFLDYDVLAGELAEAVDYRATFTPVPENNTWSPRTTDRIDALLLLGPTYGSFFGADGLATATTPAVMLIAGAGGTDYRSGAVMTYENLGATDSYLLTLPNSGQHFYYYTRLPYVSHFAPAFFGRHLQGREDYAVYFTEEAIAGDDNVVWGVYEE